MRRRSRFCAIGDTGKKVNIDLHLAATTGEEEETVALPSAIAPTETEEASDAVEVNVAGNATALKALMEANRQAAIQRRWRLWWLSVGVASSILLPVALSLLLPPEYKFLVVPGVAMLLVTLSIWIREKSNAKPIWSASEITRFENAGEISELIDITYNVASEVDFQHAYMALTRLLCDLTPETARRITPSQRAWFRQTVALSSNVINPMKELTAYLAAIVRAWIVIGDTEALQSVRKLANRRPRRESDRILLQAARECLPVLEALAEKEKDSNSLLRASSDVQVSPAILLRPANSSSDPAPDQLLRASSPDRHNRK